MVGSVAHELLTQSSNGGALGVEPKARRAGGGAGRLRVCADLGIDSSEHSFGYLWASGCGLGGPHGMAIQNPPLALGRLLLVAHRQPEATDTRSAISTEYPQRPRVAVDLTRSAPWKTEGKGDDILVSTPILAWDRQAVDGPTSENAS